MKRVRSGDTRPMAASREAMDDLKTILAGRRLLFEGRVPLNTSASRWTTPSGAAQTVREALAARLNR